MTRIFPFRRIILHDSQRFFSDDTSFIIVQILVSFVKRAANLHAFLFFSKSFRHSFQKKLLNLLKSVSNSAFGQVIWGHLNSDAIARKNLNKVHSHLSGHVRQDFKIIFQFDLETGVWQCFKNYPIEFNRFFFCQVQSRVYGSAR